MKLDDALVLDLRGVVDKAAFMDRCATVLGLPGWFGRNWDALADSLTDLPEPLALVVTGWQAYAQARPRDWEIAQEVFATAADTSPTGLTVLLALGGSDEEGPASLG
ncbi:barstar family protein [Streptomyces vilmorinianum]|uniref:barstar family protein n=1 Tax=Streptomyces vilmorinianum TaxID=3051092 RepID=UPI0010FB5AE7|nr:barstar family protein [Streptomyces vilmorinianum]